ncbi:hypothetical protein [Vibrio hangzhouensis]|uniref:hypothetical protein n=1 Tax=Vibrio hangzhouensis TaxID=462991 RepID=UPI001C97BD5E|nr:hypothetical protein [Vibrio hangzhouensis]MBY6196310.1 hypothetical protein [Vibrio hangzhouensis]
MASSSRNKAIIAAIFVVISSILLWLELFGIVPFLVLILAFFTLVIQVGLHLAGYKHGDVFEAYQDAERTEATSLTNLLKHKQDCDELRESVDKHRQESRSGKH